MAIEGSVDEAKALFKPPEDSQGNVVGIIPQVFTAGSRGTGSPPKGSAGHWKLAVLVLSIRELDFNVLMLKGRQDRKSVV